MLSIKYESYQGETQNWITLNQHNIKIAPHLKMQK